MKPWSAVVVALLVLAVFAGLLWRGYRWFREETDKTFTYDAVLCISACVSHLYETTPSPSQEDIEREIRVLHDASITHVMLDKDGKCVDLYGTPFRVRRELRGNQQSVTATSAGPDRRFDTPDDLSHTTTVELSPPKKP